MPNPEVRNRFTFNAYDLFANFLPGAVLLFGVGFPFFISREIIPDLNLIEAILATILSFGIGLGTQSIGSRISRRKVFGWLPWHERDQPFNEKMERMLEAEEKEPQFSNIDWATRELCVEIYNLDCDGSDDTEQIFKSLLAYLESSKWSRGLRIQALHLASRGLYVVCILLFIYYGAFALGLFIPIGKTLIVYSGPLSEIQFILMSVGMIPLSYVFFIRSRHFESDVVVYIMSEFFMSQYNWDEFDITDLEGVESELETRQDRNGEQEGDQDPTPE